MLSDDRPLDGYDSSLGSGSSSSGALPETPAPSRRGKLLRDGELKSSSHPALPLPPKLNLALRVGSASAELGRTKADGKTSASLPSSLSDSINSSPISVKSIKISSPFDITEEELAAEKTHGLFTFPPGLHFSADQALLPPPRTGPTPPPHLATTAILQEIKQSQPEATYDESPNYCPHPNTIAMTTRDIPPKGWHITTEAGIVIGSSAAYHGSSVTKVSTKALTIVVTTLNDARAVATQNMLKAASLRGCNAILGMKYDTSSPVPEISLVTAYGTACVIVKDPS